MKRFSPLPDTWSSWPSFAPLHMRRRSAQHLRHQPSATRWPAFGRALIHRYGKYLRITTDIRKAHAWLSAWATGACTFATSFPGCATSPLRRGMSDLERTSSRCSPTRGACGVATVHPPWILPGANQWSPGTRTRTLTSPRDDRRAILIGRLVWWWRWRGRGGKLMASAVAATHAADQLYRGRHPE